MPQPDWHYQSVTSMIQSLQNQEMTSLDLIQLHLDRIKAVNPHLNAVVQLAEESALLQAKQADIDRAKKRPLGPLHGIPMTLKDSLSTAGLCTTAGTIENMHHIPKQDATVVQRLKAAGAILLGKTNTPAHTLSFETNNQVYGRTLNPYDLKRTPGGSSGGAAAIIASGGTPFDIGSDTGGSIRQPCHNCGLAGIKPTSGRVPRTGHWISFDSHLQALTQLGPLARYVEDLRLLMPIIAGTDGHDPAIVPMPWNDSSNTSIKGLKMAFYTENGAVTPREDICKMVLNVARSCERRGLSIREARPSGAEFADFYFDALLQADDYAWVHRLRPKELPYQAEAEIADNWASENDAASLTLLFERWYRYQSKMLQFFSGYDVILCPVFTHPALPHDGAQTQDLGRGYGLLNAFNLTGWPVVVVRAGTSTEGLPLGIQIVAQPWREDIALAIAGCIEESFGGWQAPICDWL